MSPRWRIVTTAAVMLAASAGALVALPAQAIVGGYTVVEPGYSYMGAIQVKAWAEPQLCGATLIRAQWMVTAAHCTFDPYHPGRQFQPSEWQVRIGSIDRRQGEVRNVTTIIRHPNFVWSPTPVSGFDIALIKLSSPSAMAPTSIPSSSPVAFTWVRLLGWGRSVSECPEGNPDRCPGPEIMLRQLDTYLVDDSSCPGVHGPIELCVYSTPTQTSCRGDSGGPALAWSGTSWQIVGVTSNGTDPCGLQDTIYTDVTAFTSWIAGQLGEGGGGGGSANPADLNGDGKADLLAVYEGSLGLYWYPGKGDGTFWSARYLDQAGFKLMAKRDLNRDGKADLLAIYEGSNGLYWYPGKGDGTFWSARYIDQAGFKQMALADLNGDGLTDLLAIYEGSNGLYWYPGKGDGNFWSARYIDQAGFKLMAL